MTVGWEKGLFWLWLAGAVGWVLAITTYVFDETNGFTQHPSTDEVQAFIVLWTVPPVLTFAVYLLVLWVGRRLASHYDVRWERESEHADRQFRRRG
jgi:hypothetical protein